VAPHIAAIGALGAKGAFSGRRWYRTGRRGLDAGAGQPGQGLEQRSGLDRHPTVEKFLCAGAADCSGGAEFLGHHLHCQPMPLQDAIRPNPQRAQVAQRSHGSCRKPGVCSCLAEIGQLIGVFKARMIGISFRQDGWGMLGDTPAAVLRVFDGATSSAPCLLRGLRPSLNGISGGASLWPRDRNLDLAMLTLASIFWPTYATGTRSPIKRLNST